MNGAISGVIYPSGFQVQFARDPATREITQVVNSADGTRYADQIAHLPGGPAKSLVFGNGLALSQTFNRRYEPVVIASGPVALGYGMTPAGDVSSVTDTSRVLSGCQRNTSRSFGYDFLDRLTDSPYWLSYGYDGAGNRTSEVIEGSSATYTYSPATDRVQDRWVAGVRTHAYGYDNEANLSAVGTYDARGRTVTQAVCFRHDPLGRMTFFGYTSAASVGPDSTSCTRDVDVTQPLARYKYEARGRRIARQDASTGQWTYVVSDPSGNPLSELALVGGSWTRVRDYVWLDGRPLAQVEYPTSSTAFAYYLHLDHLGRPRAMSNLSGQLVWNTFPKPYGDIAEKTATDPLSGRVVVTNLRLPGQYDERLFQAAGLNMQGPYYNWNRWYLPSIGRYLELDAVSMRGVVDAKGRYAPPAPDWYFYGRDNPLRFTDLEGLTTYWCTKPLDFSASLGGSSSTTSHSFWDSDYNPLAHWYFCVVGSDGKTTCGGKGSANGLPLGPGAPTNPNNDTFSENRCRPVSSDQCRDDCVTKALGDPSNRGTYIFGFTDCQMWVTNVFNQCTSQCSR